MRQADIYQYIRFCKLFNLAVLTINSLLQGVKTERTGTAAAYADSSRRLETQTSENNNCILP